MITLRPFPTVFVLVGCVTLIAACDGPLPSGPEESANGGPPPAGSDDRIFIDGNFSDWRARDPRHVDPDGDAPENALDLGRLWMSQDRRFLYMRFELDRAVNLQEDNDLTLHLDTDADDATGLAVHGLGADLSWTFGARAGTVRTPDGDLEIGHADLGLYSAPTVTSSTFEIAIERDSRMAGGPLFRGDTLDLLLETGEEADRLPDSEGGLRFVLRDEHAMPPVETIPLTRSGEETIRALSYNVERDGLFEPARSGPYRRLLSAIGADLIGLQEVYAHDAETTLSRVLELTNPADSASWHAAKAGRDLVAVTRFPIAETHTIPGYEEYESAGFLLDTRARLGAPTLFILTHPPCCNGGTPPANARRQDVVDGIVAFIRDARTEGGDIDLPDDAPIVVAGDMNFVGDDRQPHTLRTGQIAQIQQFGAPIAPDWDETDLLDLAPPLTGLPMNFTWYSAESSFPPGRLDYIFITDSVLEVERDFVLFTPAMRDAELARYDLRAEDALTASDHLPVVADLRAR